MSHPVAELFRQAADLNHHDPRRHGSLVHLPEGCEVLVAGDVHGHRRNFTKILAAANVSAHPARRLVLQEIIHGEDDPRTGQDRSIEMLMRAVRLKLQHPGQVVTILSNHDVAQITGNEVTKQGRGSIQAFVEGVRYNFGEDTDEVLAALEEFLRSQPLGVRCPGGVLITHSLPYPQRMEQAGTEVFRREYREEDFHRGHPAYEWTWGRGQTAEQIEQLAAELEVAFFVIGHQHVEQGWQLLPARGIVITSDHDGGCLLHFPGDETLTPETVEPYVHRITALTGAL